MLTSLLEIIALFASRVVLFISGLFEKSACFALLTGASVPSISLFDLLVASLILYVGIKIYATRKRRHAVHPILNKSSKHKNRQGDNSVLPADFDVEKFLDSAKISYSQIQDAWDKRDFIELRKHISPAMMRDIRQSLKANKESTATEILLLDASLIDAQLNKNTLVLFVFFDALLREGSLADDSIKIQEIWCFTRSKHRTNAPWRLDEIQNVA